MIVDLEGSHAFVHHPFLQGDYELVRGGLGLVLGEENINANNSLEIPAVWQKSDAKLNKKFYIFQWQRYHLTCQSFYDLINLRKHDLFF